MADNDWHAWGIPIIIIGLIVLIIIFILLLRKWLRGPMYKGKIQMDGKTVIITGGNTGIGKITAMDLAKRGAKVIILCRDLSKAQTAIDDIKSETGCDVTCVKCDLASLESVRTCAAELKQRAPKIHVLINNAGVMMCPQWETTDGFEMQFGTNHLGHFLLTYLLKDNIKAASPSRIVNVSSMGHAFPGSRIFWEDINMKENYNPIMAYAQSKLANILFTKSLAKKLKDDGVTAYALHPGAIKTDLVRHVKEQYGACFKMPHSVLQHFLKSPLLGAQTSIYCAVDENLAKESGLYYSDCKQKRPNQNARSDSDAERLWKVSLEMVGLEEETKLEDIKE